MGSDRGSLGGMSTRTMLAEARDRRDSAIRRHVAEMAAGWPQDWTTRHSRMAARWEMVIQALERVIDLETEPLQPQSRHESEVSAN